MKYNDEVGPVVADGRQCAVRVEAMTDGRSSTTLTCYNPLSLGGDIPCTNYTLIRPNASSCGLHPGVLFTPE
jgi:hypothetical protein